ncbi:MAG TPA: polysaccharide deacetylase family protein [Myxococcota bacterium]|nr:polysaccharide deacetylase family protein [Myxococcota bacterium]
MQPAFDRGIFTLSLDFELVWGSRDLYQADLEPLRRAARTTREQVFGPLLAMLNELGIIATWATVGSLFLGESRRVDGRLFPDLVPPTHRWHAAPWLTGVPEGTEQEHPEFYGRSLVQQLVDAGQEVGSHSFTHPVFGDPGCTAATAETELARCVREAEAMGIALRSFVFPRNVAGHVGLLKKYGFTCWRGLEPVWYRHPRVPGPVSRLAHLGDVATIGHPPTVLPYRDTHGLWVIPASTSFLPREGVRRAIPMYNRVRRATRCTDGAVKDRRISHFWIHPINLATEPGPMLAAMRQVLSHAAGLRDQGKLEILPMGAIAERCEGQR